MLDAEKRKANPDKLFTMSFKIVLKVWKVRLTFEISL